MPFPPSPSPSPTPTPTPTPSHTHPWSLPLLSAHLSATLLARLPSTPTTHPPPASTAHLALQNPRAHAFWWDFHLAFHNRLSTTDMMFSMTTTATASPSEQRGGETGPEIERPLLPLFVYNRAMYPRYLAELLLLLVQQNSSPNNDDDGDKRRRRRRRGYPQVQVQAEDVERVARSMTPGVLRGYERVLVREGWFPEVREVKEEEGREMRVVGMVVWGVLDGVRRRGLVGGRGDGEGEGGFYERREVSVEVETGEGVGRMVRAEVWVWVARREGE